MLVKFEKFSREVEADEFGELDDYYAVVHLDRLAIQVIRELCVEEIARGGHVKDARRVIQVYDECIEIERRAKEAMKGPELPV